MPSPSQQPRPINILLVDDDEGDVLLTTKALKQVKMLNRLDVAQDGLEAMQFLRKEEGFEDALTPDLILLDLNMPRMDGREVLTAIKQDERLKAIPVVILTTSDADKEVIKLYSLQANCYVTKPVGLDQFTKVVQSIGDFWISVVKLPTVD